MAGSYTNITTVLLVGRHLSNLHNYLLPISHIKLTLTPYAHQELRKTIENIRKQIESKDLPKTLQLFTSKY
jgi:hypothetical protein